MRPGPAPRQSVDRYHAMGLARNPFAGHDDVARFVSRGLPNPPPPGSGALVQVIGHKGAGKTTHLRRWQSSAPGPYHYVPPKPRRQRWQRPPMAPIVYGDEIDRMPAPLRRWWFRRLASEGATAVIGTHANLESIAAGAGLATITHRLDHLDRETLDAIIHARLRGSALPTALGSAGLEHELFTEADLEAIHAQAQGSIRDAEVLCHTLLARRVHDGATTPLTLETTATPTCETIGL